MARRDPIAHLARHPIELPPRLVEEVLALGPPGIERLLAIVADPALRASDEVTVANAVIVLGHAREPRAIPALIELLAGGELDDLVYLRVGWALDRLAGPELLEPLLAAPLDGEQADDATRQLARCGVHDERIRARIAELLRRDVDLGTAAAEASADPALVPDLQAALDRLLAADELDDDGPDRANAIVALLLRLGVEDLPRTSALRTAIRRSAARMEARLRRVEADLELARTVRAATREPAKA